MDGVETYSLTEFLLQCLRNTQSAYYWLSLRQPLPQVREILLSFIFIKIETLCTDPYVFGKSAWNYLMYTSNGLRRSVALCEKSSDPVMISDDS